MDSCYVHMHQVHQVIQQRSKYDVVNYFHNMCEVITVNIIVKINIMANYYKTLWQNILIYRIDNYTVHLQVHMFHPLLVASWPRCMLHITGIDWFRVQANNNSDVSYTNMSNQGSMKMTLYFNILRTTKRFKLIWQFGEFFKFKIAN